VFGYDAPALALVAAGVAGLAVWRWPMVAPRVLAAGVALYYLGMPVLIWGLQGAGGLEALKSKMSLSWALRLGYWDHAAAWIADHPLRGWGLEASRMFSPGIQLHPHDAALQIWLELGLIGAVAAAVFWAAVFVRLSRPQRDPATAAAAASAVAYTIFAAVSFGVWQEWWLALGALVAACATAVIRQPAPLARARAPSAASQGSTAAPISE
jgi:O-antigen ligase